MTRLVVQTGMYYLRSNSKSEARKSLGADVNSIKEKEEKKVNSMVEVEVVPPEINGSNDNYQKIDSAGIRLNEESYQNGNGIKKEIEETAKASTEISQEEMSAMALIDPSTGGNPIDLNQLDFLQLYQDSFKGIL